MGGHGIQERRVKIGGDLRQLIRGYACRLDVARGQDDLDVGGEHPGPGRAVLRLIQRGADRGRRDIDLTLREPQLRKTRLRLPSRLEGLPVAVLGLRELPAQPVQLGLLVAGHADHHRRAGGITKPVAGLPHFVHGIGPRAVELHELGAMHQALTAERHQIRLGIAPAGQRRGPLLRPAQIEDLLTRRDHPAVGDPGNHRGHLAGGDRHHDLVEQCDTLGRRCQPDQRLTPAKPGQRLQVRVTETPADLGGPAEGGARGRGIAARHTLQRGRQKQIPLLDTVQIAVVKQPPGPGEPAAAASQLTPVQKREAQPERAPGRPRRITKVQPFVIRPRQDARTVVVPAGQVSGHRKPFKILRRKRYLMIRGRQPGVRIRPGPPSKGPPAPIECIGRGHTLSPTGRTPP